MQPSRTFLLAMLVSTGLFLAARLVVGSGAPEPRPLARSLGVAALDGCSLSGRIEGRTNGVFAVFEIENPTPAERPVAFHYLVARVPAMSAFSRMMPMPQTVKQGAIERRVAAGRAREELLVLAPAEVPGGTAAAMPITLPDPGGTNAALREALATTPETWTLVVARNAITAAHGWGAVAPAAADTPVSLDRGEVVLASTVPERKTP